MKSEIIQGNCIEVMKKMSDNSIQCIVTSPPYWGLRDYGHPDQIGLEDTPEEYVNHLVEVFAECKRILKKDGTIWLNLGDTYYSKGGASRHKGYSDPKYPNGRNGEFEEPQTKPHKFLKAKDLCGIPFRVAFALQERLGLYLRQAIIWHKPNAMPSSVTDRPSTDYEFIFLLTKSEKYYYDDNAIKEPSLTYENRPSGVVRDRKYGYDSKQDKIRVSLGQKSFSKGQAKGMGIKPSGNANKDYYKVPFEKNCRAVWSFNTQPYPEAHFAVFPEELPERCIKAGTKEGDTVLDPFAGSGTTIWVAKRMLRNGIGIELSKEYIKLSLERTAQETVSNFYPLNEENIIS